MRKSLIPIEYSRWDDVCTNTHLTNNLMSNLNLFILYRSSYWKAGIVLCPNYRYLLKKWNSFQIYSLFLGHFLQTRNLSR